MATSVSTEAARSTKTPGAMTHIAYMDGFRGLAAWSILFAHTTGELLSRPDASRLPKFFHIFSHLDNFAHYIVAIFIVLSGYVLMLPVAKSADGRLRGGMGAYFKRRFLRIVPAYYAALALTTLLLFVVPNLRTGLGTDWDHSLPAFTPKSIVTHLLLIHNLFWDTVYRIDGPAWTVSTEWEIYLLLPLVFLPVWRRWGVRGVLAAGVVLGYAPHYLLHARFEEANPHFIFLFALGMTASIINHNPRMRAIDALDRVQWSTLSALFFAVAVLFSVVKQEWTFQHLYLVEISVGLGALCFMVYATRLLETPGDRPMPIVLRILNSRLALWLGALSYTLYVVHYPLVGAADAMLLHVHVGATASMAVMMCLLVGIPIFCYGFHLVFEKPFLVRKDRMPASSGEYSHNV
jgi:peptidoglycan/LPS O-acetylase OafA/YrhL